jgi:hypothetical protein
MAPTVFEVVHAFLLDGDLGDPRGVLELRTVGAPRREARPGDGERAQATPPGAGDESPPSPESGGSVGAAATYRARGTDP